MKYNRNEFLKLAGIGIPGTVCRKATEGIFYPGAGCSAAMALGVGLLYLAQFQP